MWGRKKEAVAGEAGEVQAAEPPKRKRMGYFERRRQRRKHRRLFEELVAWIVVPALIYGAYLAYKAVGGLPPGTMDFLSEVASMAMRGGKQ